eukprot:UN00438
MYLSHFLERRALSRSLPTRSRQRKLTEHYNALVQRYKPNNQKDLEQQQQQNIRIHTTSPQLKKHVTKLHPYRERMMYLRKNNTGSRNNNNNNIMAQSSLPTHRTHITRQLGNPYINSRFDTYRDTMIYRINNLYGIEIINDFIYLSESFSTRNIIRNAQAFIRQYNNNQYIRQQTPVGYDMSPLPSRIRFNGVGDV